MAYVSHSPQRWSYRSARAAATDMSIVARSALVAIAAGVVVVGLSAASKMPESDTAVATAKGDRMTAVRVVAAATVGQSEAGPGVDVRRDANGQIVYVNDQNSQTTTVSRGATIPLSDKSPLSARN